MDQQTGPAKMRLAGIEPAHPAPEAGALSIRPQARIKTNSVAARFSALYLLH